MEVFKSGILLEEAQEISFLVRYVCLRQFGVLGSADSPQGARGIFFFLYCGLFIFFPCSDDEVLSNDGPVEVGRNVSIW